jgi:hypothetical protein
MVQFMEELETPVANSVRVENKYWPLISEYYKAVTSLGNLQSGNCPLCFTHAYESLLCEARVSIKGGRQMKEAEDHKEENQKNVSPRALKEWRTNHL